MESSINGIIEKIKKDGVGKAEAEAARIIADAEKEKEKILKDAGDKAREITARAESGAEKLKANAETAIRQAARDVMLGLRGSIVSLFDSVVKREVGAALDQGTIKKMIEKAAEKFTPGEQTPIEAVLSEKDKQDLEKIFTAALTKEMASGVTLSSSKEVSKGFRIGEKDSGVYYDFTDEAISEALNAFLNKGLIAVLSSGNKK